MTPIQGNPGEIHEARYGVRPDALDEVVLHGESAAVKKFAGLLYPQCLAPVEFIEYRQLDAAGER